MDRKSRASRAASLDETNEEVSLWKQICSSLLKLENVQKESEPIITSVNKLHMTIESIDGKLIDLGQRRKNMILIIEI
jgi:SAGA-associated factor 29